MQAAEAPAAPLEQQAPGMDAAAPGRAAPPSRAFQLEMWDWDVFLCHAGEDKQFAQVISLHCRTCS